MAAFEKGCTVPDAFLKADQTLLSKEFMFHPALFMKLSGTE